MGVNGIYGLSGSGIDVESMVKVGMMSKQSEYDKMYKKEVKDEWTKSAYSDFYTSLYKFANSTISNYKMQSTMNAMTAASANSAVVTATANGAAASMAHTVKVTQMSSDAYLLSTAKISRVSDPTSTSTSLSDTAFKSFAQNSTNSSQYDVTFKDGTTATVDASAKAFSFTVGDGTTTKEISYTYSDLADGKTLYDLASDISSSGVNIQANYDATNDSFSMYNKSGGSANTIALTMNASTSDSSGTTITAADKTTTISGAMDLFNSFGLGQYNSEKDSLGSAITFKEGTDNTSITTGTDGEVTVDGKSYTGLTSNKLTVSGVTYTFLGLSDSTSTTDTSGETTKTYTPTSVTVTQDTDSIVSSVKQFVSDYNTMLDSLNDKIYETKYSDYEPLTKSQEAAMTTTQIEQWNTKAKSGLLYHSQVLRDIVSDMREAVYTPVDSITTSYNSASAIGISSSTDQGHLTLNEDKLKKALAADPDCVYQIFGSSQDTAKTGDSIAAASDYDNSGIANRLYDKVIEGYKDIKTYAGTSSETDDSSTLGTLILNLKTKMSDFKTQMDAYEDLLYKKYDAMETAISNLSSQLSIVTGSNS